MSKSSISRTELKRLGRLLRKARENSGLTPVELAQRSGVSIQYVQEAEDGNGKPSLSSLTRVLGALPPSDELSELNVWYAQSIRRRLAESPKTADFYGDLLRVAREDAGLSVRELARRSGVDAMYLSRMERGLIQEIDWSKTGAILGQLPLSEFARQAELSGGIQLRNSALQMAGDLEKLLSSLPLATLADKEWVSVIQDRLRRCMLILNATKQDSSR